MTFDDIKKVWDMQSNETMYAINESTMRKNIVSKKEKGIHITNVSELLSIVANLGSGTLIMMMGKSNLYLLILSLWMLATGTYCLVARIKRLRGKKKFDRTMLGDLDHAIDIASYQVRFSSLLRWTIIPIALLIVLSKTDSLLWIVSLLLFFAITFYASGWEHNYYKRRLGNLLKLRENLANF
ncbi:MAG: hypothetical protein WDO15_29925 [Bacteroidota bacterium]